METIYDPEEFNATKHIPIKPYFAEFSDELKQLFQTEGETSNDKIFTAMGKDLSEKEKIDIVSSCSTDLLTVRGEKNILQEKTNFIFQYGTKWFTSFDVTEGAAQLKTVQNYITAKKTFPRYMTHMEVYSDYLLPPKTSSPPDLTPGEDIIIIVRLMLPFEYTFGVSNIDCLRFEQEIKLLGSNTLADLRDKIYCSTQILGEMNYSDNLAEVQDFAVSMNKFPSGFFFIDGVFYNDFRNPDSTDYSQIIREWAAKKGIGKFETAEMQNTRLDSLNPRLGYPYVYQHKIRCEHILIFTHMRLLKREDGLSSQVYPYFSSASHERNCTCLICGLSVALWLVVDYDRLPRDRAALCNDCFVSYCYIDGKKVGNFKAYPLMARVAQITPRLSLEENE